MREVALLLALATPVPAMPPAQHLPTVAVRAPAATLTLQVAKTELQRELGLMGVTALPEHAGMLFVFPQDGPVAFWMKDTLIPLDMVFVGSDWKVRSVAARVPTVPTTMPDENIPLERGTAKYVIELSAGEASQDGIAPGVRLAAQSFTGKVVREPASFKTSTRSLGRLQGYCNPNGVRRWAYISKIVQEGKSGQKCSG